MNKIVEELAQNLTHNLVNTIQPSKRLIVGIAGVPASGKSTLSKLLVDRVNTLLRDIHSRGAEPSDCDSAIVVGLDGWHLTRAQLDAFPDAKLAHDRRGAHWTFDGESYVTFVRQLRGSLDNPSSSTCANQVIHAPSFSHELKDPTPHAITIEPHHRIIIIEGLYTFLAIEPWVQAGSLLDERWWIELDESEAKARLVQRHVLTGVASDMTEAEWRAQENDAPNGRFIKKNMLQPTKIITSVEDAALR